MSLLNRLLGEQGDLSAVERFSQRYADDTVPLQARYYRDLLPATPPKAGEQYAFEVDLDACSGCKACVTACHELNGLDESETWRDVGLLYGGSAAMPVLQHVTTACHHCIEPACMSACPVNAYEKDPLTGIVRHLDDQCLGCQYCTLACPYDVPKYNKARGIVRKCDMCSQRLAVGEAPACVQACPHSAIRIRTISRAEVLEDCESGAFLPGAPDPHFTLPTTNYKSRRPIPRNALPADYYSIRVEHSHPPLVLMLVLTQLSVGAFAVDLLLQAGGRIEPSLFRLLQPLHAAGALLFGLIALAASTCHLGRPQYAFRAVLGLKHSWLSREIVAFGLFAGLATVYALVSWLNAFPSNSFDHALPVTQIVLASLVVMAGVLGVFCSVMIYQYTRRPFWTGMRSFNKFFLTTALLGLSTILLFSLISATALETVSIRDILISHADELCQALMGVSIVKLVYEFTGLRHLASQQQTPLKRSALLMTGELSAWTKARFILGIAGGILLPMVLLATHGSGDEPHGNDMFAVALGVLIFALTLAGELCERHLFFAASVAPRMPGGLR